MDENVELKAKEARLREIVRGCGALAIAFSGGTDSTLLAAVAHQELGDRVLLLHAASPAAPAHETAFVQRFAAEHGVRLELVPTDELAIAGYASNVPDRCYFCKKETYTKLRAVAAAAGISVLADGTNADDLGDFRPGHRAAGELAVRHPLLEAGLAKREIRALARQLGLPNWDQPSAACLASRFPYGEGITAEKLQRVGAAEEFLRGAGFRVFRCRSHGPLARLEFGHEELERAFAMRAALVATLKELGYVYVTLDLGGFRSGSMNEALHRPGREPTGPQ